MKRIALVLPFLLMSCIYPQSTGLDQLAQGLQSLSSIIGLYVGNSTGSDMVYKNAFKYSFSSGAPAVEIWIKDGDMIEQQADVVVDAANIGLVAGGGVTGILQSNAKKYADDTGVRYKDFIVDVWRKNKLNGLGGVAKPWLNSNPHVRVRNKTKSHNMQIMHVAGPTCPSSITESQKKLLHDSYYSSLEVAEKNGVQIIAFPFISGGIFGCGNADGGQSGIAGIMDYFVDHPASKIKRVDVVLWNNSAHQYYFVNGLSRWAKKAGIELSESDQLKAEARKIKSY